MIDVIFIALCLSSAALIVYHHIGYPLILRWYSTSHPVDLIKDVERGYRVDARDSFLPTVTVLVPAFNEEQYIADKIRNLAALDYPSNKLRIIIACDGCSDQTVDVAQMTIQEAICSDIHFEVHDFKENRGKVAVVNAELAEIESDITALSDVSALISLDSLLIASAHFSDPQVGVVNATYCLCPSENQGESSYWAYQTAQKQREATFGSSLGSHGAFYLFRTELFETLPSNTINDDFILPMQIVKKGYRADYDVNMVALEMEQTTANDDFKRRLRISAGNMQQAIALFSLFNPKFRGVAFAFFSGKGLRLLTPYLMIACLFSSFMLKSYPIFEALLWVQISVYSLGIVAQWLPKALSFKPLTLVSYLVIGHYANFIGGLRYLLGFEQSHWTRVNR